jgi:hypothetical protein
MYQPCTRGATEFPSETRLRFVAHRCAISVRACLGDSALIALIINMLSSTRLESLESGLSGVGSAAQFQTSILAKL